MEMSADDTLAALEGWAANGAVHPVERLTAALQVIQSLHVRGRERERAAVVATLRYARVYWMSPRTPQEAEIIGMLTDAEEATRGWDMEPGWCCPFCEEIQCDDDCPLARLRKEIDPDA